MIFFILGLVVGILFTAKVVPMIRSAINNFQWKLAGKRLQRTLQRAEEIKNSTSKMVPTEAPRTLKEIAEFAKTAQNFDDNKLPEHEMKEHRKRISDIEQGHVLSAELKKRKERLEAVLDRKYVKQ